MSKGYAKWMCKVEGKPIPETPDTTGKDYLCFPGNIYCEYSLRSMIDEVLNCGVGESPSEGDYWGAPDDALEWCTHPLEDQWGGLNSGFTISQEVYECCQWMDRNWSNRFSSGYVNEDEAYEDHWAEEVEW